VILDGVADLLTSLCAEWRKARPKPPKPGRLGKQGGAAFCCPTTSAISLHSYLAAECSHSLRDRRSPPQSAPRSPAPCKKQIPSSQSVWSQAFGTDGSEVGGYSRDRRSDDRGAPRAS